MRKTVYRDGFLLTADYYRYYCFILKHGYFLKLLVKILLLCLKAKLMINLLFKGCGADKEIKKGHIAPFA